MASKDEYLDRGIETIPGLAHWSRKVRGSDEAWSFFFVNIVVLRRLYSIRRPS